MELFKDNSMKKLFIIYCSFGLTALIWMAVLGHLEWYRVRKEAPIEAKEYDYVLDNIHDIVCQDVSTTYHDYLVILDDGVVVDKGVIHLHNCKCSKR